MATLGESIVATLFDQSDDIADEILEHHPLSAVLKEKGLTRRFKGGYEIRKPVMYNATRVGGFYSHFESFDLDAVQDFDAFQFAIRQVYEPMSISGRDKRANSDEEMLLDHVEAKMKASLARLKNTVATSLRGDGTLFGGREFDGIQKAISTTPTSGTYGKIDRTTNTWAQNATYSASDSFSVTSIQGDLTAAQMEVTRGSEMPDIGLMTAIPWQNLHKSLTAIQRLKPISKAMAGFRALNWNGVDYGFDGGYGGAVIQTESVRLINSNYVSLDLVRGADFKPLTPKMDSPVDQDAEFVVIIVEGNLCFSAPALQTVIS